MDAMQKHDEVVCTANSAVALSRMIVASDNGNGDGDLAHSDYSNIGLLLEEKAQGVLDFLHDIELKVRD